MSKPQRLDKDENGNDIQESTENQQEAQATQKRNLATFKFDLINTVNADPALVHGCLSVVCVFCHFLSSDGSNKNRVYATMDTLMTRTGLTKPTIIKAKRDLAKHGYLKPTGKNPAGAETFEVFNPKKDDIDAHVVLRREELITRAAFNRAEDRRKRLIKYHRSKNSLPLESGEGSNFFTSRGKNSLPNTLEETVDSVSIEGKGSFKKEGSTDQSLQNTPIQAEIKPENGVGLPENDFGPALKKIDPSQNSQNAYAMEWHGMDRSRPFPKPKTEMEAEAIIEGLFDDRNLPEHIRGLLTRTLWAGRLDWSTVESFQQQRAR